MAGPDPDVLEEALRWLSDGREAAIATVVETWGSSPRPRGSQLAVREDGLFVGSVSGGCVEGKVIEAAQTTMQDRAPRLLEFGVSNEQAWEVGLACGGTVRIYVEVAREKRAILEALLAARTLKRGAVVLTPLDGKGAQIWTADQDDLAPNLVEAAVRALATDDAFCVETAAGAIFVQPINPPLRLAIVGAVHIARPLSSIAGLLGYEVTVVDPREAFARIERWTGVAVTTDWPDEALAALRIDHRTAVVALSHDPKLDDPALEAALRGPAFYIGALGSRKTHGSRLRRLAARGFDADQLKRIHGPIGLKIGARSPGEIAVSIVAQMTEILRNGGAAGDAGAP
jgi:xanthine dehydrogenase accessory factor